jgi:hypothetical protein
MLLKAPYKASTTYRYAPLFLLIIRLMGYWFHLHIFFLDFTLWIAIPKNKNHEQDHFGNFRCNHEIGMWYHFNLWF